MADRVKQLEAENALLKRRLQDSVNARAVIEGTLILGLKQIPEVVRDFMRELVANALENAKEVDGE